MAQCSTPMRTHTAIIEQAVDPVPADLWCSREECARQLSGDLRVRNRFLKYGESEEDTEGGSEAAE